MNRQKILLILTVLFALSAALTMTRCGSGVGGAGVTGDASGMKF